MREHGQPIEGLKLHRPAADYRRHAAWQPLMGADCSLEQACRLLAAGLASHFVGHTGDSGSAGKQMPRDADDAAEGAASAALKLSAGAAQVEAQRVTPRLLGDECAAAAGAHGGDHAADGSVSGLATAHEPSLGMGLQPCGVGSHSTQLTQMQASPAGLGTLPAANAAAGCLPSSQTRQQQQPQLRAVPGNDAPQAAVDAPERRGGGTEGREDVLHWLRCDAPACQKWRIVSRACYEAYQARIHPNPARLCTGTSRQLGGGCWRFVCS